MKCYVCGKEVKRLYEGLCEECYIKKYFKIDIKKINLKICNRCNKIFFHNKELDERRIEKVIKELIILPENFKIKDIRIIDINIQNTLSLILNILISFFELSFERIIKIDVPLKKFTCDLCRKRINEYYEAKIQIRGGTDKIKYFLDEFMWQIRRYNVFISKVEELDEGIDIYVSDSRISRRILEKLKRKYGFEIKYSSKLHSFDRQRSKRIYKLSILLRFKE